MNDSKPSVASVSSWLSNVTKTKLMSTLLSIFKFVKDKDKACVDSGATHVILNNYLTFNSFKKVMGRYVVLGNNMTVLILGEETAKLSINGKVIIVRGALFVPDLRGPLYSLRKHGQMSGCGMISHYDVGSYVFFPLFALQIDDSVDNVVIYKSIGRGNSGPVDYEEPRT